nr:RDD family protein [Campylobacter sp.]
MSENILDRLERENIKLASFDKRLLAYFIDEIIIAVVFSVTYWNIVSIDTQDFLVALSQIKNFLIQIVCIKVLYHTIFIWYYGATLGKIWTKIICIDATMLSKPNLTQSFLRAVMKVVGEALFYIGFIWFFENRERQTWQDKIAQTVVCDVY